MNEINQIESITQKFITTFGHLNNKQLNWKPHPTSWSIAQNLEHLIIINNTYFPITESIRNGTYKTPFIAKIGFIVNAFGKEVLKAVAPDRKKRMKTFSIWEPSKSEVPDGILDRFEQHQTELKEWMISTEDLVEQGVVISSPANKYIVYKLEKLLELMVAHEQRHFEQSLEVLGLMQEESREGSIN